MEDWLKSLFKNPRYKKFSIPVLVIIISYALFQIVTTFSDLGFSEEITKNRLTVIGIVVSLAVLTAVYYYIIELQNQLKGVANELVTAIENNQKLIEEAKQFNFERTENAQQYQKLNVDFEDLGKQNKSLLRLMELYKAEAQQDVFNRLKQLAVFAMAQENWKKKNAHIERFIIEDSTIENSEHNEFAIIDRVTVITNLGISDGVLVGMQFVIQDPIDSRKYGIIVVRDCYANGSACSITSVDDQAFWLEVKNELHSKGKPAKAIFNAQANIIVPHNPFRSLTTDSARQLLDWLQNVEGVEL